MAAKKKKQAFGYLCDTCGKTRRGAHTDVLKNPDGSDKWSTAQCPECMAEGKTQKYQFLAHVNSAGTCEMIAGKCPTHGEIKQLFAGQRQEPRFQANYSRWLTGTAQAPPRIHREV